MWSRDRKSSSGSSGADAGSRTVTGDSLVCGGLGGVGGRPRGLPLLLHTGAGRRPASLDQGSAVDGVYLCSSPSGQSESDGGLGLRLPSSPLQLCRSCLRGYPPWSCDPAPSPLERVRGSRTVTWDVQGGRWLSGGVGSPSGLNPDPNPIHRWGVALGGSLYLYLPEANALRLSTGVRPSMVCFSALRPRATVSQMVVLGFGLISSPILCRWPSRSD